MFVLIGFKIEDVNELSIGSQTGIRKIGASQDESSGCLRTKEEQFRMESAIGINWVEQIPQIDQLWPLRRMHDLVIRPAVSADRNVVVIAQRSEMIQAITLEE